MTNIDEVIEHLEKQFKLHREARISLQKEILLRIFPQENEFINNLYSYKVPYMVILGSNLSKLEALFAENFKTHVSPLVDPNRILITLEFGLPNEDPYWAARLQASPWFDVYGQIKDRMRPWNHTSP